MTWARGCTALLRSVARCLGALLVASLLVLFVPSQAWSETPSPVPPPVSGGQPQSWTCNDRNGPSPYPTVTVVPSPLVVGTSPSPKATTTTIYGKLGQDCTVTSWAAPNPWPSVAVSVGPATVGTVSVTAVVSDCPASSASSSPSPSAVPSPSPSPSRSCGSLPVTVDHREWDPLMWMLGSLLLLAVAGFVVRYSKRVSRLGT